MCWGRKEHIPLKVREGDGPKSSSVLCAPLGQTGAFLPERWFLRIPPPPRRPASQGTPGGRPPVPTTQKSLRNPLSCQIRNTNPNWTQTQSRRDTHNVQGPWAAADLWLPGVIHSCVLQEQRLSAPSGEWE